MLGGFSVLKLIHAMDMDIDSVKNYYDSFEDKWKDLNCYAITHVAESSQSYLNYVNDCEPNLYYLINDKRPDYIIGFGTIKDSMRLNFHVEHLNFGNIGYGIRPIERKKGYGTMLLKLLLLECEKRGMHEVCVSCLKENIASNGIIKNNKGKLEKEFFDEDTGKWGLKYWIKLHPKIYNRTKRLMKRIREDYIS